MNATKKLDLTKPVQTRDGRKARILCDNRRDPLFPVIALVEISSGLERAMAYTLEGAYNGLPQPRPLDLINVPQKQTLWLNLYPNALDACGHPSRESADADASSNRIACVEVTFTEGQGL